MSECEFDVVNALVEAMVAFDPIAAQHLSATAAFAVRLARALQLDESIVGNCRASGLLHDIGQFGIEKAALTFPGMLVNAEWEMVLQHPIFGERLISRIPSIAHLAPIVRSHHERFDGTGYPDALAGHEIPIESRVIAVADAFHTMTMPQPYRSTSGVPSAIEELLGNSGSQFDSAVVDAFVAMMGYRRRGLRLA
jgi:HD-GYP domain-containing protein (c-di-GMP phosphodiesterase class II)